MTRSPKCVRFTHGVAAIALFTGVATGWTGTAAAQSTPVTPAQAATAEEIAPSTDIIVTARKREERLQDVPLAIQSFSQQALQDRGIVNLQQLSQFTPGLKFQNQGAAFGGRYISAITFRGMNVTSPTPTNQIGSLFVDGIYVLGGAQSVGLEDVARVEVIKGPQSAFFGRSTFGGAINYITADPSDTFKGRVSADYSPSYNSYALSGTLEGPIVRDLLSARLTASVRQKGAQYRSSDGGDLGRERTVAVNGSLLFKPANGVRVKVRATYSEDNDSGAASTIVGYNQQGNCPAGTPLSVLDGNGSRVNVTLSQPYYCGTIPNGLVPDRNTQFITIPASGAYPEGNLSSVFLNNSLGNPQFNSVPSLNHFGLRRIVQRYSATIEYDLSSALQLVVQGGINDNRANRIEDADQGPLPASYAQTPTIFKDQSAEVRLSYNAGGRLRASIGANYYHQTVVGAFANATEVTNLLAIGPVQLRLIRLAQNTSNDTDETFGIFGSVEYDIFNTLTATFEGRYQNERLTSFGGTVLAPVDVGTIGYKKFLPRAILTWKPDRSLTIYGSYSEGVLPGLFNTSYLTLTPTQQAAVNAALPGVPGVVPAETLKSYELGIKQSLFGGRGHYTLAAYQMDWNNMKSLASAIVPSLPNVLFQATVPGSSRIKGVEFEAGFEVTPTLTLEGTVNYTDGRYRNFASAGYASLFGLTGYRADGNRLPRYPKWSATASAILAVPLSNGLDGFGRADVLYQGKMFIDETNLNSIDPVTRVNVRAGVRQSGGWSAELFVNNLFQAKGYETGISTNDLTQIPIVVVPLGRAALLTPVDKREAGIRVSYSF